ncbi:coiled-coil domain-containing protein 180 [Bombina bombina]|uniref:coiled-coil domain-containing protein 180 n=1 Tax=Bombina bombina TaxID=8345 RepID=UPI00235ACF54|nr:coiled-coil domain-containing protein 180 [Bombina bombina]
MATVGEIHVVPSGKVYRQMFDAEVQLVRSLGEVRARAERQMLSLDSGQLRDVGTRTTGVPSHYQHMWEDSLPYGYATEDPVVHRERTRSAIKKNQESKEDVDISEVRGLCDVIVPEKTDSGILQRISANRRERHDVAISDLHHDLADISREMESDVLEVGKSLQQKLSESDEEIELLFQQIEDGNNTILDNRTLKDIWDKVTEATLCRRQWINETEQNLFELEEKRAERITEILKSYTALLTEISYLMQSDVHRMVHSEAMMINQALLANHRAIARLSVNLMEADLKREGALRLRWQDLNMQWKRYQKEKLLQELRGFAHNELSQIPGYVKAQVEQLMGEHQTLKDKRIHYLHAVSNFVPPSCTKAQVCEWHASLEQVQMQTDVLNAQFVDWLRSQQEDVCQKCVSEAQKCKAQLWDLGICSSEEADNITANEVHPLIEQLRMHFVKEQETVLNALDNVCKQMVLQNENVFRFASQAIDIWDTLEMGLLQQEKDIQQKLSVSQQKYDAVNQAKESALDMILDRLRQESSQEHLQSTLGKALASLEEIKAGYEMFNEEQSDIIDSYPAMVLGVLRSYSSAVSEYFGVKEVYGQEIDLNDDDLKQIHNKAYVPKNGKLDPPEEMTSGGIYSKIERGMPSPEPLQELRDTAKQLPQEIPGGRASDRSNSKTKDESLVEVVQENGERTFVQNQQEERIDAPAPDTLVYQLPDVTKTDEADLLKVTQMNPLTYQEEGVGGHVTHKIFTTSRGNRYTVLLREEDDDELNSISSTEQVKVEQVFLTEAASEDKNKLNLDIIIVSKNLLSDLKKILRLGFYEHLEGWYDEAISKSLSIVIAKKEELKAELNLRYHMHEPRSQRIEMDIHNVRAAELVHHSERVTHHCAGVDAELKHLKAQTSTLIENTKKGTYNFRSGISSMEKTFLGSAKSDKLEAMTSSLPSILDSHISRVQTVMRNYRQHVEETLGSLCDTNSDFIKSFRLFSEGGNFSPDEVEVYRKQLHQASADIASFEGSIMVDLEGVESLCLEQATEIVKKCEEKFIVLTADKIFLENIQKLLTNLQVKIKTMVVDSNFQAKQINTHLQQIEQKTDACARPNMDKEVVTAEELYGFVRAVMGELRERGTYLSCLLEPTACLSEPPLQGPIAAASRADTPVRQEHKIMLGTPDGLLNPSRVGKLALDDTAVSVIRDIMRAQQAGNTRTEHPDADTRHPSVIRHNAPIMPHPPDQPATGSQNKKKVASSEGENSTQKAPSLSVRKLIKPSRFDKKYQVFGEKIEESSNFKGILRSILWQSNDTLLYVAEEFYKKKERRSFERSEFLHENFEDCADMLTLKLQSYETQALEYHNACLLEFQEQLEQFEKLVSQVPALVIESHRKRHLDTMFSSAQQIRQAFLIKQRSWDVTKEEIKRSLRPSLGHPENYQMLENLCQLEEKRQEEEAADISHNAKQLQDCVAECARQFASSLASLCETMLVELDDTLTADDITQAKAEVPKEKLLTLIRRRQSGLSLERTEHRPLIERGSRVWPGITLMEAIEPKQGDFTGCRTTASVTSAKTTLGHASVLQARDSAYLKANQDAELELEKILEETKEQRFEAERWKTWWSQSVLEIKQLYA